MICCQFVFRPGVYDDEFHRLDRDVDAFARSLPGFVRVEVWNAPDAETVNAIYYFTDYDAVRELARFPRHLEAKGQVRRWYDRYRVVVSTVTAIYGDDPTPG